MADLTAEQRADLKAKAEAATPGPWERAGARGRDPDGPGVREKDGFDWVATVQVSNVSNWRENAEYLAAASPDVVLALLAENGRLFTEIKRLQQPPSVGPTVSEMTSEEKVLRWATRYCSDMGSGPNTAEQVAIDDVRTKLAQLAEMRAALERISTLPLNHHQNASSLPVPPSPAPRTGRNRLRGG